MYVTELNESNRNLASVLDDIPDLDPCILKKAEQEDSFAHFDIGEAYFLRTNLPDNYEKAFYWLNLAGQQRNIKAQFILGDLYALGKGTEKDEFKAYQWYMKSAIQGYPKALTRLHNLYHTEKSMHCRGQRNAGEEEWTQSKFKERNKIRELFEYRVDQMESELTKTIEYCTKLFNDCRKQNTTDAHVTLGFLYQHGYGIRKITSRAIEFYTLAAEEGSTDAQYNLGSIYHAHHNMKWNYREAFKWYSKAAESGNSYAQSGLAFLYQHGLGAAIDYSKTIYLYTQAAEMRNVQAQISLGCIYRKGEIVDQDVIKAKEWYKRAIKEDSRVAQNCLDLLDKTSKTSTNNETDPLLVHEPPKRYSKKGLCSKLRDDVDSFTEPAKLKELQKLALNAMKKDGNAMFEIGLNYYHGNQFKQDKDTAFRWIYKAAKAELVKAQLFIAEMYKNDDYIEQDYLKSSIWYTKATKIRNNNARYQLGQMYYHGLGVRKDPLEASRWYTLAAEKKHGDAQCQFGFLREKGEGLRQDVLEAIQIYTDLAKEKHPEAIYRLAVMYESGNGVEPNFQQALLLYNRAAHLGCLSAQLRLGQLYSNERGQVFSFENAFKHYEMAANQNHPEAKYRLAILYLDGSGVEQDFIQAYKLFNESKMLHYEDAEDIFHVPFNNQKISDIDLEKLVNMFKLVCKYNFSPLDYNLGYHHEHEMIYQYKSSAYTIKMKLHQAKTWYETASSKNNPRAQYRLGLMYETGKGVSQDLVKALDYYKMARVNGNTDATYKLAHMYLNGNGVSQNIQTAFDLFLEASHKEPSEAFNLLLESYEPANDEKKLDAKALLEEIAESGNIVIQYQLGFLYINTELPNHENVQEGIKWLLKASKGGYIDASYQLGVLYENGIKVLQNVDEAIRFYKNAANKGHENALYQLAQFYHYGKGVNLDYLKAFELYTEATKYGNQLAELAIKITNKSVWANIKGELKDIKNSNLNYDNCLQMWKYVANIQNPDLQYQLGKAYEDMGADLNLIQAKKWYSKAAKCSHGPSLYRLGRLFESGLSVRQNYEASIKLYNQSAITGNNDALCALGNIYQHGKGVELNIPEAFSYYKIAAENGDRKSQLILGTLYEKGDIENGGLLEAIKWFSIASSHGSEEAHSHLKNVYETDSSNDQINVRFFHLLTKLIKLEKNINRPERSFFSDIYYRLGCMYFYGYGTSIYYEKAWQYFKISHEKYGEGKAAIFLDITPKDQDSAMKASYLKKLEMWEVVADSLKKEELYELGMLYYYGVYENINNLESDEAYEIVKPNSCKSVKYLKMVIGKTFLGI
ncbi:HCP-like protein [Backusella circina FSU 941]|nr:HCP-like protein [Backusella circina FSU 941]